MTRKRAVLLHVVLPLAGGVLFYLAVRPRDILLFSWMQDLGLQTAVDAFRRLAAPLRPHVPALIGGSLPDGVWAYAFGAALGGVWRGAPGAARRAWLGIGLAITAFLEVGQAVRIVPGVFDVADLVAMTLGYALGAWVMAREPRRASAPLPTASLTA